MTEGGSEGKKEGSEVEVLRMNNSDCGEGSSSVVLPLTDYKEIIREGKWKGCPPNNGELHP